MINLGTVDPGSTIYIPFESFASSTGAPITITGLATSDIQVFKDGSMTQRASASGFTLLDTDGIDLDSITGIHGFSIDLADNTTADFWAAGSRYTVVVSTITVDSQTMSFIAATFRIGKSGALLDTTIATLASQTSFTLTSGPAEDDALNGHWAIIHDAASAVQFARVLILDYTGSTKTVTLAAGATFTVAAKDNISIMGMAPLQPTDTRYKINIASNGDLAGDIGGDLNGDIVGRVLGGGATPFSAAGVWAVKGTSEDALAEENTLSNIISAIGGFSASGANTILGFLKAIASKSATLPSDIGGTFDPATDSLEGIVDVGVKAKSLGAGVIDNTSVAAETGLVSIRSNTAQSGTSASITLDASASSTTDFYKGRWIRLTGGTGSGQVRLITAYNGSTKAATVATWATAPDNTTTFAIINAANIELVGTLTTYTGNTPQTGDAYAIVNSGTHGNAALKSLVDAVGNFIDTEIDDIRTRVLLALPAVASGSAGGLATYSDQLAIQSALVTIFNDTDELQQDWTNGGRLDVLVDSIIATLGSAGAGLTAITGLIPDIYHADIYYTRDDAGAEDVYKCVWMKNGIRITSGITSPTIQVVKEADGSNLIASSAMTEIGTTEAFKYTATTTARQTAGESCLVIVGATIDGEARTFVRSLGRDSTA